jgi:hypothetical protein
MDGGGFKKNPRTNIITPAKTKIWERGRPAIIIKRPNTNTSPPEKSNGDLFTQQVVSQPYISLCRN